MGYSVTMDLVDVVIPEENIQSCLDAINTLHEEGDYSWVDTPPPGGWDDLKTAFMAWRYEGRYHDGAFYLSYFEGQKLGDDEALWGATAAYIRAGGYILCCGEEHDYWMWRFNGTKLEEGSGEIIFHFDGGN